MSAPTNLIDRLQNDIVARLRTDDFFEDIVIIQERAGTADTQVQRALAGQIPKASKYGAFLIIELPEMQPEYDETPGPQLAFTITIHTRVIPKINNGASGTGKPLGMIARRVNALFHLWLLDTAAVMVDKCEPYSDDVGTIGFQHTLTWHGGEAPLATCAAVLIAEEDWTVTLTCATEGADIYYTLDDSMPWSGNADAVLYTAPFAVDNGTAVRAAAYRGDRLGSFVTRALIGTEERLLTTEGFFRITTEGGDDLAI